LKTPNTVKALRFKLSPEKMYSVARTASDTYFLGQHTALFFCCNLTTLLYSLLQMQAHTTNARIRWNNWHRTWPQPSL